MSRGLVLASTALVLGACTSGGELRERDVFLAAREAAAAPARATARPSARRLAVVQDLERLLESSADPATRFWANYHLAQVHAAASAEPFLTEPSTRRDHLGSIQLSPERRAQLAEGTRFSETAHLVSVLDHAGRGRRLLTELGTAPPPPLGWSVAGEPAPPPGAEALDTNLALLMATSYARLGFRREVALAIQEAPRLLTPASCLAFFEEFEVRPEIRPWVCEMVSTYLRETDELVAYRFAVMAVEAPQRFGHGLPEEVVARLEGWILNGASVRFVCPRSQTGYIPGRERSPLSGIPHMDYVTVAR